MSVIRKVICDCCGKEIEGNPYRVKIFRQNPFTYELDDKYVYEDNDQDLCLGCASRAMEFMVNLTVVKNTCKKVATTPAVPEMKEVSAVKPDKDSVLEMFKNGASMAAIAKETGIKYSTVYSWVKPDKCKKKVITKTAAKDSTDQELIESCIGKNADRHKCKNCKFRSKAGMNSICDYTCKAGHSRGCNVEDCYVFEKGTPVSKRKTADFYK